MPVYWRSLKWEKYSDENLEYNETPTTKVQTGLQSYYRVSDAAAIKLFLHLHKCIKRTSRI